MKFNHAIKRAISTTLTVSVLVACSGGGSDATAPGETTTGGTEGGTTTTTTDGSTITQSPLLVRQHPHCLHSIPAFSKAVIRLVWRSITI
ncbi:MAG: hypothetical protein IPH40_08055 [Polaromonas sp.]|nr:hypothetical protein [Polaromonas sp.]